MAAVFLSLNQIPSRAAGGSRPRPPLPPNRSNYLVISARCKAAPLAFLRKAAANAAERDRRREERGEEERKLGTASSGRPIGQRADCRSASEVVEVVEARRGRQWRSQRAALSNVLPLRRRKCFAACFFPETQSDRPQANNDVIISRAL